MPYLGNEPAVAYTSTTKDTFSGDASTTDFTMSKSANVNAVRVVVENVVQNPTVAYTCSGTTLSFTSAPPTGTSNIYVVHLGPPAATVAPPTTINNATTFTAGIVLDNEDSTLSGGEVLGKIEFKDNDGGSAAAGVTSKIESLAVGDFGASALTLSTSSSSGGARTALTERMRVDNKGNVGIGTDTIDVSTQAGGSGYKALQIESDEGGQLNFDHNDAGTGSTLGQINFQRAGEVVAEMEGVTDGETDSGRIAFRVQATTGALTEAGRFNQYGNLAVGQTTGIGNVQSSVNGAVLGGGGYVMCSRGGGTVGYFNRNSDDGVLISFYGQATAEGNISVSGSTVSYNGGHLSRWSQLSDNTKDTSIVKGTVMTNLDKMAVWTHAAKKVGDDILDVDGTVIGQETEAKDAWTENNEQLNCMAVSSVEGDANVAGVFVNWDEDDDIFTNDMNVAMTGDMVIRIAKGVTVARGDLLMSAGDGTAKPQDDDIVRSKTIAKVTSANVSHTYDDESYLVPCVLMAC